MESSLPYNLEELEKKCRRYYARRMLFFILAVLAVALPLGWAFLQFQTLSVQKGAVKSAESNVTASEKKEHVAANCFALQMLYSKEKFRSNVEKEKAKLEEAGLDCYLKSGKTLEDGSKELFLRCNAVASKKEIEPFLEVAKLLNKNAYVINEECRFAKKYVIFPQVVQKRPKPKKEPKEQRKSSTSSDNRATVKEAVTAKNADLEELQKLFAQRESYNLAIKIAREFFERKNYKEALQWAKRANKLDRSKEEAWILYARSLYALGKKEQARRILRLYLEYANSKEAQKLLREWR